MGCTFSIRRAASGDLFAIAECLQKAFAPFRDLYTADAYNDTVPNIEAIERRLLSMKIYVAVTDTNELVGTISCNSVNAGEGHLRGMAVDPAWQGCCIGQELLATAESTLAKDGCSVISLDTTAPLERAIRFYEGNGFQRTGKVTDFFGMPLYEYAKKIIL